MASRRMLSNKIIDSARFIKMPISSQCLYFHLIAKGDDDGVVEAFNVMRTIGATEDDLKVLVAKGFVQVLNEDLVTYITDWQEHNWIRADRKIDSIYKDLLLQIVPDVKLLEKKPSYYSRKKEEPDNCQTNVSIGKYSIDNNNSYDNNNIYIKKEEKIYKKEEKKNKEQKKEYGEYKRVKLTDKEYEKLCNDFNKNYIDKIIVATDEYVESNNNKNKYTNFNLVIRRAIREKWFNISNEDKNTSGRRII